MSAIEASPRLRFTNPQLAAEADQIRRRRRHKDALKAGYLVLKIQRPLALPGGASPDEWLYTSHDDSIATMLPYNPAVAKLMGDELKVYVYAKLIPDPSGAPGNVFEIVGDELPPEQDW